MNCMKNSSDLFFIFSLFLFIWVLMLFQLGSTLLVLGVGEGEGRGAFWGQSLGVGGKERKRDCMCAFRSSLSSSDSTLQKVSFQVSFES